MTQNLRPYQVEAVHAAQVAFAAGARAVLTIAATGTGKTTSFSELVRAHLAAGGRGALVLAQRRELLDQAEARLRSFGVRVVRGVGLVIERGVAYVASVQSVARRLDRIPPDAFDLVVLDEAGHAAAPQHLAVLRHFRAAGARVAGYTATPDRADGASLGIAFERCVARYDIAQAVRDGYLVPARGVRVEVEGLDLSQVRQRPISYEASSEGAWADVEDLHPGDLGRAVIAPAAVEGVVGPLVELAEDRPTVVFAVDRRHGRALADALCARRAGCARFVHGAMRKSERRAALEAFGRGEYQFLVNVNLLVEGFDVPAIACVALARPTTSRTFVAQAIGRALRLSPGKEFALVLDFTTATSKFKLVGPADVLGGALVEPVSAYRQRGRGRALADAAYSPRGWAGRFATRAVDLMGRAGRRAWSILRALIGD